MKALTIIVFSFLYSISFANEIDKLQNATDVNKFLAEKVNKRFTENPPLKLDSVTNNANKNSRNRFFKIDIDDNGLTDLVISGEYFISIIDKGNDVYQLLYYNDFFNHVSLIAIDSVNFLKRIIINQTKVSENKIDTLIYRFNGFVEYNPKPMNNFSFEKIKLRTNYCFGECPVFEMIIYKNRIIRYNALEFNKEKGSFWGILPKNEFEELIALIKYFNPQELKNEYTVNWTDDQTITTEINYNGKRKNISDYGGIGSFGLRLLYKKIFDWRGSLNWKE